MEDIKVSIITPVYNGEQYLERYFESISKLEWENLEVIIVNDGSKDGSLKIIEKWKERNSKIIVVTKTYNQGVSVARNQALDICSGKYIFFFDCDDFFAPTIISDSVKYAVDNDFDTVLYNYAHDWELSYEKDRYDDYEILYNVVPASIGISFTEIIAWVKGERKIRENKELTGPWKMLYSKDIIDKERIRYKENLRIGEDTIFTNQYLCYAEHVGVLRKRLYYLQNNDGSAINEYNGNAERMICGKLSLIDAKDELTNNIMNAKSVDLSQWWGGEYIISSVQIAYYISYKKTMTIKEKVDLLKKYHMNTKVQELWKKICAKDLVKCGSIKAIPLLLLKFNMCAQVTICFMFMKKLGIKIGIGEQG